MFWLLARVKRQAKKEQSVDSFLESLSLGAMSEWSAGAQRSPLLQGTERTTSKGVVMIISKSQNWAGQEIGKRQVMISLGSEPCKTNHPAQFYRAGQKRPGPLHPARFLSAGPSREHHVFSLSGALTPLCRANCPHKTSTVRTLPIFRAPEACLPYLAAAVSGEHQPWGPLATDPGQAGIREGDKREYPGRPCYR